jgi:hypothetical protein
MFSAPPDMLAIDMACRKRRWLLSLMDQAIFLPGVGSGKVLELGNGATKAKRRLFERLGWKVLNIPYFDWRKVKGKGKRALVCRKLNITVD